jgi:hypothetical protein
MHCAVQTVRQHKTCTKRCIVALKLVTGSAASSLWTSISFWSTPKGAVEKGAFSLDHGAFSSGRLKHTPGIHQMALARSSGSCSKLQDLRRQCSYGRLAGCTRSRPCYNADLQVTSCADEASSNFIRKPPSVSVWCVISMQCASASKLLVALRSLMKCSCAFETIAHSMCKMLTVVLGHVL